MESQQDIVDLTINNDDDFLFPTEPSETANLLKMDGIEGNKETAKQNHEDDTLSVYGSEDGEITAKQNHEDDTLSVYGSEEGEIVTDEEEEKDEESKKIFSREFGQILDKSQKKQHSNPLHSMFTHAAIKLSIQGKWKSSVWDSK